MAGVKGRSGGAREGAGAKRQVITLELPATEDPLAFLLSVQNNPGADIKDRISAAKAAASIVHGTAKTGGKKQQVQDAADAVGGRFAPGRGPRLKAVG